MDPAAGGRRVVHADVVHVREQDRERDHELAAVARPHGQQDALDRGREIDDAGRDVAHMDDPVVGEQRGMSVGGPRRAAPPARSASSVEPSTTGRQNRSSSTDLTSALR